MIAGMISVGIFVSIVTLILMIILASSKQTQEERFHMVKMIYYYAISFITLLMVIGGGIALFIALADVIAPAAGADTDAAINSAIKCLGWIVIPGPIFYFTQRRIREIKIEKAS
jgi:membrane-associated HD superfamily phosphohydrolase